MAHQILKNDKQQGRVMAWHGLTEIVPGLNLRENFLRENEINPLPVYAGGEEVILPDGRVALVGSIPTGQRIITSDADIIGNSYNPETYTPIGNNRILNMLESALEGTDYDVESLGTIRGRSQIFVTISTAKMVGYRAGGRDFKPYLNLLSSHDMSIPLRVSTSNICVVCANTFGWSLADVPMLVVRHSKNALDKLEGMSNVIDAAVGVQAEFAAAMEQFDNISMGENVARRLFAGFVAPAKAERLSTRAENTVERITALYRGGAGNRGSTLADAFSALTDYYTHESSGGGDARKQYVSSEYGTGAQRKRDAFEICRDGEKLIQTVARGEALLQNVAREEALLLTA